MTAGSEHTLWVAMRKNKPNWLALERLENRVSVGIPDVLVIGNSRFSFVELKIAVFPVRTATPVLGQKGLRQSQKNWHWKAEKYGAPSFVLIRDKRSGSLLLVPGCYAQVMNEYNTRELKEVSIASDWPSIFKALCL